jgi:hypothetical protein
MFTRRCHREWRAEKIFGISHSFHRMPVAPIVSCRSRSDIASPESVFPIVHAARCSSLFVWADFLSVSRDVSCTQSLSAARFIDASSAGCV